MQLCCKYKQNVKSYSCNYVVFMEKTLYGTFPCLVVLTSNLNFSHISIKFHMNSNVLASPKAGQGNCLDYVLALCHFPASQGDKYIINIILIQFKYPQ